jgi:hypothetical protein
MMSTLCEIADLEDVASILVKTRDEEGSSIAKRFQAILTSADERTGRDMEGVEGTHTRDTRDVASVGREQPLARAKPAPSARASQGSELAGRGEQVAAMGTRATPARPSPAGIDRVRGRVAALRGQGWEVRG